MINALFGYVKIAVGFERKNVKNPCFQSNNCQNRRLDVF